MTAKTRLLLAADTYHPKVDGVLIFMEEFMKRTKDEFDLHLLVPGFSSQRPPRVKTTFLEISGRMGMFNYQAIKISRKNLTAIKSAVQESDLVFIQELAPVGWLSLHYARKFGKKTVLYVHNTPWEFVEKYFSLNRLLSKLFRKALVHYYNSSDLLLIPYQDLERQLRKAGVHTRIQVARLGVDIERFTPSQNKTVSKARLGLPAKPVIGYVGRISNEKNTLVLLHAFKKLKPDRYFLLMVGDGREDLVRKFRDTKNCLVTGFVKNVEDYLKAMDVFVMPSLTETTSLATLEAMASGLAVITTKVGFIKDYLIRNYNGTFFPRRSATVLSSKLDQMLQNQELQERFGRNARKTVAYSFSWERSINRIKRLLQQELAYTT